MEVAMTLKDFSDEFELTTGEPASQTKNNIIAKKPRPKKTNIPLWLSNNRPRNVEELQAVRYTLYHRCSHADFKVSEKQDKNIFILTGRQSSVLIVSNKARRYLLWRLRILAKEEGWVGRKRIKLTAAGKLVQESINGTGLLTCLGMPSLN